MSESESLYVLDCRVEAVAETHISDWNFDSQQHHNSLERYESRNQMVLQCENVDGEKRKQTCEHS
jgi:hypothetical protein